MVKTLAQTKHKKSTNEACVSMKKEQKLGVEKHGTTNIIITDSVESSIQLTQHPFL